MMGVKSEEFTFIPILGKNTWKVISSENTKSENNWIILLYHENLIIGENCHKMHISIIFIFFTEDIMRSDPYTNLLWEVT